MKPLRVKCQPVVQYVEDHRYILAIQPILGIVRTIHLTPSIHSNTSAARSAGLVSSGLPHERQAGARTWIRLTMCRSGDGRSRLSCQRI